MLESASAVVVLLAAAWVYGVDHLQGDILRIPVFGILVGGLASLGMLVVVPVRLLLVVLAAPRE